MRRLLVSAVLIATPVGAETAGEIVITGQGLPAGLGDTAYDVKVIDRARLEASASNRLEDVLRDAAGFHQFRRSDSRSAHPTSQGASLRGLGGNASARALVLLDGVPVADPFGGWIDWPALDPRRFGFVRVTRGGGAGPFGAGALAGTIEISSATPDQLAPFAGGVAYGSRDSLIADAGVLGELGGGFVSVSGRFDQGDGFVPIAKSARGAADIPADYRQWSTRVRAVVPLGDDAELQAAASLFGDDRSRGTAFSDNSTLGQDASVRLIGNGRWAWEALAYLQARQFSSLFAAVAPGRSAATASLDQYNTPATGYGAKIELRPPLGENAELRIGVDYRQVVGRTEEKFTFVGGAPTRLRNAGGRNATVGSFIEASLKPLDGVTLTGGGRIDHWQIKNGFLREKTIATGASIRDVEAADRSHWKPTGRIGIAYNPAPAITLRSAGYLGYRLPTLNELYRPFRAGADATAANVSLRPERLRGVEASVVFQPLSNARAGATLFWNRLDNAIANVTVPLAGRICPGVGIVTGACRARQNVDAIRARGVEVDAGVTYGHWDLSLSYAYADSRVRASGLASALDGLRPAQTAKHNAGTTVSWRGKHGLTASITGRYLSGQFEDDLNQRRLDDATTVDAVISVPLGGGFSAEARAENLMNTRVEAAISGTGVVEYASPRTLWLALRYTGR